MVQADAWKTGHSLKIILNSTPNPPESTRTISPVALKKSSEFGSWIVMAISWPRVSFFLWYVWAWHDLNPYPWFWFISSDLFSVFLSVPSEWWSRHMISTVVFLRMDRQRQRNHSQIDEGRFFIYCLTVCLHRLIGRCTQGTGYDKGHFQIPRWNLF